MTAFRVDAGVERPPTRFPYSTLERSGSMLESPMRRCPACGSDRMDAVMPGIGPASRCQECGRCWTCEAAGAFRVNPLRCPGCTHQATCFERLREDFAGWWSVPGLDPADV